MRKNAPTYLCDIDGTIADGRHRHHFIQQPKRDWKGYFDAADKDRPNEAVATTIRMLASCGANIEYVTGRPERYRTQTMTWMKKHFMPKGGLMMRPDNDRRDDHIIKGEFLDEYLKRGIHIVMIFDDRQRVVDMWRSRGMVCAQVAPGTFDDDASWQMKACEIFDKCKGLPSIEQARLWQAAIKDDNRIRGTREFGAWALVEMPFLTQVANGEVKL